MHWKLFWCLEIEYIFLFFGDLSLDDSYEIDPYKRKSVYTQPPLILKLYQAFIQLSTIQRSNDQTLHGTITLKKCTTVRKFRNLYLIKNEIFLFAMCRIRRLIFRILSENVFRKIQKFPAEISQNVSFVEISQNITFRKM